MTPSQDISAEIVNRVKNASQPISSMVLAKEIGVDHAQIDGQIRSLMTKEALKVSEEKIQVRALSEEGLFVKANGDHHVRLFRMILDDFSGEGDEAAIQAKFGRKNYGVGLAGLMKNRVPIKVTKTTEEVPGGKPKVTKRISLAADAAAPADTIQELLEAIQNGTKLTPELEKALKQNKKRNLWTQSQVNVINVTAGPGIDTYNVKLETELTTEMLTSGAWREATFKPLNLDAEGRAPTRGHLHPLLKVRTEYRNILTDMGFSEMPTDRFVESSFWNFDTLFQPQQHPARDEHDTFFMETPAAANRDTIATDKYFESVRETHQHGMRHISEERACAESHGYEYDWSADESLKNILRTHTTAVSARMLYDIAQKAKEGDFRPCKLFSIDRVFRNETLDATHLAEFHQVEGFVCDRGLHIGHLQGLIREFFEKLGMPQIRFKPAYNPYTEPSMEIFAFHEGLGKWIEVGNSGVFRPEMLRPMGMPEDVSVIAWGLSLERPTMIKLGINNIRELVGHKLDLEMVARDPVCRFSMN